MRYKGKAANTTVASEKYLSPSSNEIIALKMMNRLLSARIVYVFFNKLGIGSTSLKLKKIEKLITIFLKLEIK